MEKTPEEVSLLAKKHGFDAVEIRLDENGTFSGVSDPFLIRKIFEGVTILSINTGITVTHADAQSEKIKKAASFAASCGACGIRIFADPRGGLDPLSCMLASSSGTAKSEGTFLLIETHGKLTATADIRKLLELTDFSFSVIWDVLHTVESGEPIAESARNLGGVIAHVHLKDAVKTDYGYKMTKLKCGDIRPSEVRGLLDDSTALSLEWEGFWHEELRYIYRDDDELLTSYLEWLG